MPSEILGRRIMWGNWTIVSEFVLVSFSALSSEIQALLFLLFLIVYLVTLTGNVLIILVTTADSALHSPMYFFLRNLSFLEIGFNLVIVPKVLGTLMAQDTAISFLGCAAQMYFFFFFGVSGCCLLATMAYDATWPSATLCATRSSWVAGLVPSWQLPLGSQGFQWPLCRPHGFSASLFVAPTG